MGFSQDFPSPFHLGNLSLQKEIQTISGAKMSTTTSEKNYPSELGNLICQDSQSHLSPVVVGIASVVVGVGMAAAMYLYGFQLALSAVLGFAICGLGIIIAVAAKMNGEGGQRTLSLFENGLLLEKPETSQAMLFEDMDKFRYSRTSVYVNGVYSGDTIEMKFEPEPGSQEKPIVFSASVKDESSYPFDFNQMIELVSEEMSLTMAADLADNGQVEWVNNVLISAEGINAPIKSMISSSQQFIPWADIKEYEVKEGRLKIKLVDAKWSSVKFDCKETNFYPGYKLFCRLHATQSASNQAQDLSASPAAVV